MSLPLRKKRRTRKYELHEDDDEAFDCFTIEYVDVKTKYGIITKRVEVPLRPPFKYHETHSVKKQFGAKKDALDNPQIVASSSTRGPSHYLATSLQNTNASPTQLPYHRPLAQPTANNDLPKKRGRRKFEGDASEEHQCHPTRTRTRPVAKAGDDSKKRSKPRLMRINDVDGGEVSVKREQVEEQGGSETKGATRADESAGPQAMQASNTTSRVHPTPSDKTEAQS